MKKHALKYCLIALAALSPSLLMAQDMGGGGAMGFAMIGIFLLVVVVLFLFFFVSRYKRCPADKILVIYGKTGQGSAKCIHGGAAFIWPVIQDYQYLDLQPMSIDVNLSDALSKQNIRVSVPSQFTVAISNKPNLMKAAAERLLGMKRPAVVGLAEDIIMGQMRLVIANMDIEELNTDRDKFVSSVFEHVGNELHKVGLDLINVNVRDIHDESGYIRALGQEAAAKAINEAKVKVALEERTGAIGQASAARERRTEVAAANSLAEIGEKNAEADAIKGKNLADIQVAESDAERRRQVAAANSLAEVGEKNAEASEIKGKNIANIDIAESDAERRMRVAESNRNAEVAEKTAKAEAERQAYLAQKEAEEAKGLRELAARRADEVVHSEIAKEKAIIDAQAEAERTRLVAKGEADAELEKFKAQAEGIREVLDAQAEGFLNLVKASGDNPEAAIGLLLVDKIPELAKIQADAIKNIKFDKVTVFDGGNGDGVSNMLNGVFKSVPALEDFLKQSGMGLPEFLAKSKPNLDEVKSIDTSSSDEA